jgi:hypothetical protein
MMILTPDKAVLFIHSYAHLTSNVVLTLTALWAVVLTNLMRQ